LFTSPPSLQDDLSSATSTGYSIVRVLTIVRVLGVIRLVRFFETTHVIGAALKRNFLAFGLLIILVLIASLFYGSLVYYAEKQHETFDQTRLIWIRAETNSTSPFQSIYGSMWWAIVTLCTVGYGDAVPVTAGGKVVGAATMVTGILVRIPNLNSNFIHNICANLLTLTVFDRFWHYRRESLHPRLEISGENTSR
jgi:hypothetical protein